jgi:hypothetical protein
MFKRVTTEDGHARSARPGNDRGVRVLCVKDAQMLLPLYGKLLKYCHVGALITDAVVSAS